MVIYIYKTECVCVSVILISDNIDSYINVKFYYLLNETTPGSVAITVLEL